MVMFSTLLIAFIVDSALAFPNGAPALACKDMVPGHLPTGTSGTNPFMFNISATTYKAGDEISGMRNELILEIE